MKRQPPKQIRSRKPSLKLVSNTFDIDNLDPVFELTEYLVVLDTKQVTVEADNYFYNEDNDLYIFLVDDVPVLAVPYNRLDYITIVD